MGTWNPNNDYQEEEEQMPDDIMKNETVKFGAVILEYIGQQFAGCGKLITGGGMGAWKGILGGLALLLAVGLIMYLGVAVFRGMVDGDIHGFNIPQIVAIAVVVLAFASFAIPANAVKVTDNVETELVGVDGE